MSPASLTTMLLCVFLVVGCGEKQSEEQHMQAGEIKIGESKTLTLSKDQIAQIDLKTEIVGLKLLPIPLTFPAKVMLNDRSVAHISARVNGRIEKVNAFVGDRVRQGDVLIEIYSQEFLAMQSEFTQAEERLKRTAQGATDYGTAQAIYKSVRSKLLVVGCTVEEIDRLEGEHAQQTYLRVRAPFSGTILNANARSGEFAQVGTELYTVADLTTLWVIADIYEKDLQFVHPGMTAIVIVSAHAGMKFSGNLTTLYDVVDEKTRTVKARIEVKNTNGVLKPGMFATVDILSRSGKALLVIPASALLGETGSQYVFAVMNDSTFEQRPVRIGAATKDYAEVITGLIEGERVVVQGGFFLKSELGKSAFGEE
jgi:cobalt-zinc-cadmium efflux system membrane fusion protein